MQDLLQGLIDYAGLYPPAALDMDTAVRNSREYSAGAHCSALGRFIVDAARLTEFREAAGDAAGQIPLSVVAQYGVQFEEIKRSLKDGIRIEAVEVRCEDPIIAADAARGLPPGIQAYVELPLQALGPNVIDALGSTGARAKIRMGGVTPSAIPPSEQIIQVLQVLVQRGVAFKATAGLHHPVRSRHRMTYAPDAPTALMHGFVNLFWAAALTWFGDEGEEAKDALEEQDAHAFGATLHQLKWRSHRLSRTQVRTIRQEIFTSFGSCSFAEPIEDLEELGWL